MKRSKRYLDEQIERLLAGDTHHEIDDGVADLVSRLQSETVDGKPTTDLAATLAAVASDAESTPTGARSRKARPLPLKWRRRIMLSTFLSSLLGKLLVGSVALAASTGGLAAAGELPDPAQAWASEQLGAVGIDIPDGVADDADDIAQGILNEEYGDPSEDFGKNVAEDASDEESSNALDKAEDQGDNADVPDEADVADEFTDGTDGTDVADDNTEQVDDSDVNLPDKSNTRQP